MTWVRLDDNFYRHHKVRSLSHHGFRVWVSGLAYCSSLLTDGAIPSSAFPEIGANTKVAKELIRAGLWEAGSDGSVVVHDYLDYQTSRSKVQDAKRALRERVHKHRNGNVTRYARVSSNATVTKASNGSVTDPDPIPSHPIPRSDQVILSLPTDKQKSKETASSSSEGSTLATQVREVFDFWRENTGKKSARLDRKRDTRIRARLSEKFTPEELKQAIANRANDPWLMGKDPKSTRVYDDLETLLRDAAQVERLRDLTRPSVSLVAVGNRIKQPNGGAWKAPIERPDSESEPMFSGAKP